MMKRLCLVLLGLAIATSVAFGAPTNMPPTTNSSVAVAVPAHVTPLHGQIPQYNAAGLCEWSSPTNLEYVISNVVWGSITGTIGDQSDYFVQYTNLMYLITNGLAEDQIILDAAVATNDTRDVQLFGKLDVAGNEVHSGDTVDMRASRSQRHRIINWPATNNLPAYITLGWTNENRGDYFVSIPTTCEYTNSAGLMVVWTNATRWALTRSGGAATYYSSPADFNEGPFAADWHDYKGFDSGSYVGQWYEIDQDKVDYWDTGIGTGIFETNDVAAYYTNETVKPIVIGATTAQANVQFDVHGTASVDAIWINTNLIVGVDTSLPVDLAQWATNPAITHIIPSVSGAYNVGSATMPFSNGYFLASTIYLGSYALTAAKGATWDLAYGWGDHSTSVTALNSATSVLNSAVSRLTDATSSLDNAVSTLSGESVTNIVMNLSNSASADLVGRIVEVNISTNLSYYTNDVGFITNVLHADLNLNGNKIYGDGTAYMTIQGTNGVAINMTTCSNGVALHVSGPAVFAGVAGPAYAGKLIYVPDVTGTNGDYQFYDGDEWQTLTGGGVTWTGGVWSVSGSDTYRASGGVGIGTSNITDTLTLVGTASFSGGNFNMNSNKITDALLDDDCEWRGDIIAASYLNLTAEKARLTALESDVSALEASNFWSYISANLASITRLNTASNSLNTGLNTLSTRYLMTSNAVNSNATAISVLNTATNNLKSRIDTSSNDIVTLYQNAAMNTFDINTIEADNIARDVAVVTLQYATNHLKSRIDADVATMTTLLGQTNTFLTADKGVVTNAMSGGIGTGNGVVNISSNTMTITFPSRSDLDEWSYHLAHSDVNIAHYDLNNVKTLFCTQIVLNGVALTNWSTNWSQGGFTNASVAGAGTTTVTIEYSPSALWLSQAGTIYCYMWKDWTMSGAPDFTNSWVVPSALQGIMTKTITNTTAFVGPTYWYAFFDVDGDGILNNLAATNGSGGLLREPAALGEFMPLHYTNSTDAANLTFVLVDKKGGTYRYGWPVTSPRGEAVTTYTWEYNVDNPVSLPNPVQKNTLSWRNFVCEQDCIVQGKTYGGLPTPNLYWFAFAVNTGPYVTYHYASKWYLDHQSISGGEVPSPFYPVKSGGVVPTITSQNIVFQWKNSAKNHSSVRFRLSTSPSSYSGFYQQYDYMENEHNDGTVRLLVSPSTANFGVTPLSLENGVTYYWQISLLTDNLDDYQPLSTTWGSTASFVYQP